MSTTVRPLRSRSCRKDQRFHSPTLHLEYVDIIARGSYGTVCKARQLSLTPGPQRQKFFAVKVLRKPRTEKERLSQQRELEIHMKVRGHANIVWLEQVLVIEQRMRLVMEYGPGGNLHTHIRIFNTSQTIKSAFMQILSAITYCHSRGVYHQDLKPQNILLFDDGAVLKLADFGLATMAVDSRNVRYGTHAYMSPECQQGLFHVSAGNDIWSLGIILANLICKGSPWKRAWRQDAGYLAYLERADYLTKCLRVPSPLSVILGGILEPDTRLRFSLSDIWQSIRDIDDFAPTNDAEGK